MSAPRFPASDESDTNSPTGRRLYNPYQDLQPQIPYKTLYDLPTSPEFLFQEESHSHRRSWGENLTYYTGVAYLAGSATGAALGLKSALSTAEPGESAKIRVNRLLNSCGHEGRRLGNKLGVIGLMYAGLEGAAGVARDGKDDWVNSVAAGLGTGALFKAASGPRSAAVAGAIGGVLAGAATAGRQVFKRYIPI